MIKNYILNTEQNYVEYNGYKYYYKHRVAKDREIVLATTDIERYCNGFYTYSCKDPGDGICYVIIKTDDPNYPKLNYFM